MAFAEVGWRKSGCSAGACVQAMAVSVPVPVSLSVSVGPGVSGGVAGHVLVEQVRGGSDSLALALGELPGLARALTVVAERDRVEAIGLIGRLREASGLLEVLRAEKDHLPQVPVTYSNVF